jgi:hypothetical protein
MTNSVRAPVRLRTAAGVGSKVWGLAPGGRIRTTSATGPATCRAIS